jgi:hypothetical protein
MAKLTVEFKDGETVSDDYSDYNRLAATLQFLLTGLTIKNITIEDVN